MSPSIDIRAIAPRRPIIWRFIAMALVVPAILVASSAWLGREYAATEKMRLDARALFDRRVEATSLIARIADAESSQRGFVLTNDTTFLDLYAPARLDVMRTFDRLRIEMKNEPVQARLLDRMHGLASEKFIEMDRVIAVRRGEGLNAAIDRVKQGHGKQLMDRMRAISGQMLAVAETERDGRVASYLRRVEDDRSWVWVGIGAVGLALLLASLIIWRQSVTRYRARLAAYAVAERNRSILDSTTDAIAILNPSGTIETINAAASRLVGYRPEELERRDVSVLIDLVDRRATFHERIGLADGQLASTWLPDRKLTHKDGHEISVDLALGVMPQPDGDHIVASARDVSERKRIARIKDDFISTVSHELRTPLTSVIGALGLLRAGSVGELPAAASRLIEIAENNSRRLIRLINDMLDIDRIRSGQLQLVRKEIDLRDVVARACEGSSGLAVANDIGIDCDVPEDAVMVSGDADRLLQVVTNLASNAIRVSPAAGRIVIGVNGDQAARRAIVSIDDDGPGVPDSFRDRIFGRFERAEGEQGIGTGLGLVISREIVERHDGRIWFEDRPGGGSRFAFELDLLRGEKETPEPFARSRILIVEDDIDMAETLRKMIAELGHATYWAATATQAREALAAGRWAAILLDLRLSDESGSSLAHALYSRDDIAGVPIIIVSALDRDSAAPVPFDVIDWIEKPVGPARLAAAVRKAIERSGSTRPTVLHLDDDQDMLDVVASALSPEVNVLRATDIASARALLATESPDVAILDLHLAEGSSGLELLPMLTDAQGRAVPTIIFSAHDVGAAAAHRVDAVLIKSRGSLPDLQATIRRILRDRTASS